MSEFSLPTEHVELPSQGLVYPEDNPLSSGKVEIKYMTAKEEDILTNSKFISEGVVIDKLLKAVIVSKVNYDDIVVGDKNAIMVACRILGYGSNYKFYAAGEENEIDLSKIENKKLDKKLFKKGKNEFEFTLPHTKTDITFKLLSHADEQKINRELKGYEKLGKGISVPESSTRLKHIITSVNGDYDPKLIRKFVDEGLLARDSRALRKYINEMQPDVDLTFFPPGSDEKRTIPININFFWPDA
jgi:hypothetical protein